MSEPFGENAATAATFILEVDGVEIGRFSQVRGLEVTIQTASIPEGGQNGFEHQLPGRMSWPPLIFRRPVTQNDALLAWLQRCSGDGFAGEGNKVTRSTAAITLIGQNGARLRAWEVEGALPRRYSGPEFASGDHSALFEELEVVHHGFRAKTF